MKIKRGRENFSGYTLFLSSGESSGNDSFSLTHSVLILIKTKMTKNK